MIVIKAFNKNFQASLMKIKNIVKSIESVVYLNECCVGCF